MKRPRVTPAWWRTEQLVVGLAVVAFAATLVVPGSSKQNQCRPRHPPAAAAAGLIAFSCYGEGNPGSANSDIYVVQANGTGLRRLTRGWGWDIEPAWSPDGSRIAFVSTRDGQRDIYVMRADGAKIRRLTGDVASDRAPAWSPDGSKIAFESDRAGGLHVFVMNVDGAGVRRLTSGPADDFHPAWSPDGTRIAYIGGKFPNLDIYVMDADGSNPSRLTTAPGIDADPAWSPDGSRIVFSSQRDNRTLRASDPYEGDLFLMDADGTGQRRIVGGGGYKPAWSPDGSVIAFNSDRAGPFQIYLVHPDGSGLAQLVGSPLQSFSPNWQPVAG